MIEPSAFLKVLPKLEERLSADAASSYSQLANLRVKSGACLHSIDKSLFAKYSTEDAETIRDALFEFREE